MFFHNGTGECLGNAVWVKSHVRFEQGLMSELLFLLHSCICVDVGIIYHSPDPHQEVFVVAKF